MSKNKKKKPDIKPDTPDETPELPDETPELPDEAEGIKRKYDVIRVRKNHISQELKEAFDDFKAEIETRKAISENYDIEETGVSLIIWKTVKE